MPKINRYNFETFIFSLLSVIIIFLIVFTIFWLQGCSCKPDTIIKDRIITVTPPVIHDTVPAIVYDTVIVGTNIFEKDTISVIKYFPKWKYFDYKIKPDTVLITIQDTISQTKIIEKNIETPLLNKIGLICLGFIFGFISFLLLKLKS